MKLLFKITTSFIFFLTLSLSLSAQPHHGHGHGHGNGHNNNNWEDCDCEMEWSPVCVVDSLGDTLRLPNECIAECLGYVLEDQVECDTTYHDDDDHHGHGHGNGHNNNNWEDCDCEMEWSPVCVVDSLGDTLRLPNECIAECLGYVLEDQVECDTTYHDDDDHHGHGHGNGHHDHDWEDCDCEMEWSPVCVVDSLGDTLRLPNVCIAECLGYVLEDQVECDTTYHEDHGDCDGHGHGHHDHGWEDCDCEWEWAPVCFADSTGEIIRLPNECIAECLGFDLESQVQCDSLHNDDDTPDDYSDEDNDSETHIDLDNTMSNATLGLVTIAPNPVRDEIQVNLSLRAEGTINFKVLTVRGQLMSQHNLEATKGANKFFLPASNLLPGIYLLTIEVDGSTQMLKFVK